MTLSLALRLDQTHVDGERPPKAAALSNRLLLHIQTRYAEPVSARRDFVHYERTALLKEVHRLQTEHQVMVDAWRRMQVEQQEAAKIMAIVRDLIPALKAP